MQWIRDHLVEDAHKAWKWLSMQFLVLAAFLEAMAEAIKQGWVGLPEDLKAQVPGAASKAIGFLVLAAIVGRLLKQKNA